MNNSERLGLVLAFAMAFAFVWAAGEFLCSAALRESDMRAAGL